MQQANLNERLKRWLEFTDEDLAANNRGELSKTQRGIIISHRQAHNRSKNMVLIVILVCIGIAYLVLQGARRNYEPRDFEAVQTGMIALFVFFIVLYAASWFWLRRIRTGEFMTVSGVVRTEIKEFYSYQFRRNFQLYELHVGSYKIQLPTEEQLRAFEAGATYRVHYLPAPLNLLLSAEALTTL